jgi:hypothetical protein
MVSKPKTVKNLFPDVIPPFIMVCTYLAPRSRKSPSKIFSASRIVLAFSVVFLDIALVRAVGAGVAAPNEYRALGKEPSKNVFGVDNFFFVFGRFT